MNITEWTAIVLLSIGVIKMLVGVISPKLLLDFKKNPFSKIYLEKKELRVGILVTLGLFMIVVSFMSNLSVAQWFVAGYTMLVIAVSFLFFSDNVIKSVMNWFSKIPEKSFRMFCVVMLVLELVALYFIIS